MPGGGHERQRGIEHVQVAPEVHAEHREPFLLSTLCETSVPRDAGDVDDGVEPAVFVDQLPEQVANRGAVGDRHRRGPGRAARCHDATGCGLLRLPEPLGAVEGYEGIHGDDVPAATAELLSDRRSDPAPAARHDGDLLTRAHDAGDRTSSSRPSNLPASSHCSSSSQ